MPAIARGVNMSKREKQRRKASVKNRNMAGHTSWEKKTKKGGACKTNNKEKRKASSTGKLHGSSKNIHKQTTNTRAEVASEDVSSGAESGNCCCCKFCQDANWKIDCTLNWLHINCKQRQQQPWQEHLQQPALWLLPAKLSSNIYYELKDIFIWLRPKITTKRNVQNMSRNKAAHCRQIDALLMK